MFFLTPADFRPAIRREILTVVNQDDLLSQEDAERAAIIEITAYLKERFDTSKLFPTVLEYDPEETYAIGDLVYFEGDVARVYTCTAASTGHEPTDTDFFSADDPRNKLIIRYAVDITLYILYGSCAPSKLPEIRVKHYDDAIAWLKSVAKGQITPDFPAFTDPADSSDNLPWGSNPKLGHGY